MSGLSVWEIEVPRWPKPLSGRIVPIWARRPDTTTAMPAQAERHELLRNFEIYLLRQRGLSAAAGVVMLHSPS
jgi:hypothetical protein